VVSRDDIVSPDSKVKTLPLVPVVPPTVRDDFDKPGLDLCWNFLRNPDPATWSITEKPGFLILKCNSATLDQASSPAFVGRRQQHFNCTATAKLEFEPAAEGETAGITVLMNENHHYDLHIIREGEKKFVTVSYRIGNLKHIAFKAPVPAGPVQIKITAEPLWYTFSYLPEGGGEFIPAGKMESRYLSSEVAGGFTGVYLGMFAEGNGKSKTSPAYFDWFEYACKPQE
jgi:alpha-N-arabinofuranosidase